jgi:hypothetical protein
MERVQEVKRAIVTYAAGAHEELLDVALPTYRTFAERHGYDLIVGKKMTDMPPAWNKVPLLLDALTEYDEVVWFDCDLVVVNPSDDFPPMGAGSWHSMVRHFEKNSEVPNSGVWRVRRDITRLLQNMMVLEVFENHGWWEQAALMTLMGYCVPPEGHEFPDTKCKCVRPTVWYDTCEFMRLCWNSHPNYRADSARIVHCSYPSMPERLEIMRALVRDPSYNYPRYDKPAKVEVDD